MRLHFVETYWGATGDGPWGINKRVNDIFMENIKVLPNLDINKEAGPMNALIKTINVRVSDVKLDILSLNKPPPCLGY